MLVLLMLMVYGRHCLWGGLTLLLLLLLLAQADIESGLRTAHVGTLLRQGLQVRGRRGGEPVGEAHVGTLLRQGLQVRGRRGGNLWVRLTWVRYSGRGCRL